MSWGATGGMSTKKIPVHNFEEAEAWLAGGRDKDERPLPGKATRLLRVDDDHITVRYHYTDIVTYARSGDVEINTGGWNTLTTRGKIDQYMPLMECFYESIDGEPRSYMGRKWTLGSENGELVVWKGNWSKEKAKKGVKILRRATLRADGTIEPDCDIPTLNEQKKLRKRVSEYAKEYVDRFLKGEIPAPDAGDCWCCLLVGTEDEKPGSNMDHIVTHVGCGADGMDEVYYVPTLLRKATALFGAPYDNNVLAAFWTTQTDDFVVEARNRYASQKSIRERLTTYLRRYLRKQLGMEFSR